MLPDGERQRSRYDREIQAKVCKFLRHQLSSQTFLRIWPDVLVGMKEMFEHPVMRNGRDPTNLSTAFRISWRGIQLDEGGVCFKIRYAGIQKFEEMPTNQKLNLEQVQSTSQSSTSWSGSGWSGSYDKWTSYRDRRYRHVQNGAARVTFALVGLALLQPGEAASTVAILAPLGSGSALLIMAKLFLLSSTLKVVDKVSEDAEFLTSSAIDAADQAISWTRWLYQIVMSILCFVLLLGSYKWVNSVGCTVDSRRPVPRDRRRTQQNYLHITGTG